MRIVLKEEQEGTYEGMLIRSISKGKLRLFFLVIKTHSIMNTYFKEVIIMGDLEKKIVQNVAWVLSVGVGMFIGTRLYNMGTIGYMQTFHSDEYNKAIKELKEEEA
jgi:hypothetical protein